MCDYSNYQKSIQENLLLKPEEWFFKNNKYYQEILEHVTFELGMKYIKEININFNKIYMENFDYIKEIIIQNDLYGKTIKHDYGFCLCSPSNFRYILHSFLILDFMKKNSINNINIIEIGGGYGGLCFFIYKLSKLFDIIISSYSIYDLHEPALLQKKYLSAHGIHITTYDSILDINKHHNNSFLISNYAFTEISNDLQKLYLENVIKPYCSYGFIAWNCINYYEIIENKKFIVEKEYPLTGVNNFYVYFT